MYLEKDFADEVLGAGRSLDASPRDLGFSRADLWAFTGLVALDKVQENSFSLCSTYANNLMCNDRSTPCYSPFPFRARNLFKTGRRDCYKRYESKPFLGYLAKEIESHPDKNGNGEKTTKYFKDNFNMIPREGLALMGAHTLGALSLIHI